MSSNKLMGSDIGQNGLYGIPVNQMDIQNEFSVLTLGYNSDNVLGFYGYTGERIPPYKGYLYFNWLSASSLGRAPEFSVIIDDTFADIATRVSEDPADSQSGQTWYTLEGVRLNGKPTQKGIYIVNGRKYNVR